jgi:hypothetical protein
MRKFVADTLVSELDGGEDDVARQYIGAAKPHRFGEHMVYLGQRQLFGLRDPAAATVARTFRKTGNRAARMETE